MKLTTVAVDPQKSEEGIWREIVIGTGFECLVARNNNSRYRAELERLIIDISRKNQGKEPSSAQYSEAALRAFCKFILLDWRGLEDDDDQPIEYSHEKAYEILSSPEYTDVRSAIEEVSADAKAYRRESNQGN